MEDYEKAQEKFPNPNSMTQFLHFGNGITKPELEEGIFREFYPPPILGSSLQFQQQQQVVVCENNGADVGSSENHFAALSMAESSGRGPAECGRKRRFTNVMMEKSVERRQKRMIKNRESAARSRAKKQAYTQQLEQEVDQLKKMNNWLKKQKELDMINSSNTNQCQYQYQLRRTSSAKF